MTSVKHSLYSLTQIATIIVWIAFDHTFVLRSHSANTQPRSQLSPGLKSEGIKSRELV